MGENMTGDEQEPPLYPPADLCLREPRGSSETTELALAPVGSEARAPVT